MSTKIDRGSLIELPVNISCSTAEIRYGREVDPHSLNKSKAMHYSYSIVKYKPNWFQNSRECMCTPFLQSKNSSLHINYWEDKGKAVAVIKSHNDDIEQMHQWSDPNR